MANKQGYRQIYDKEWIRPLKRGFKEACCGCGLVHKVNFRVLNGVIEFQCWQAPRSTAMIRRHMQPEQWSPLQKYVGKEK